MSVFQSLSNPKTQLAVLIDPDKAGIGHLERLLHLAAEGHIQHFLVGGSLMFTDSLRQTVDHLRVSGSTPVTLFPGNPSQLYSGANAVLLLSLISGRNADLLIGRHVEAAPALKQSQLEIISTGYMLIDGGRGTTVSYISNTTPIPAHKPEIAAATAMAGEMLGLKCIYLEAGSGALNPVSTEMVGAVRKSVNIPIITGGGIRNAQKAYDNAKAGANWIVVGNAIEENPLLISEISHAMQEGSCVKNA